MSGIYLTHSYHLFISPIHTAIDITPAPIDRTHRNNIIKLHYPPRNNKPISRTPEYHHMHNLNPSWTLNPIFRSWMLQQSTAGFARRKFPAFEFPILIALHHPMPQASFRRHQKRRPAFARLLKKGKYISSGKGSEIPRWELITSTDIPGAPAAGCRSTLKSRCRKRSRKCRWRRNLFLSHS